MGWSREAVRNYAGLAKIDRRAWSVIGTAFQSGAAAQEEDAVPSVGTTVPFTAGSSEKRADHIDEWRQLTVGENNPQPVGKPGRPSRGHQATASALGISHETVRRAEAIAGLPQAVRDQAREERWSQEQLLNMARDKDMRFPPSCPGLPRFLEKGRGMPCRRRGIRCTQ